MIRRRKLQLFKKKSTWIKIQHGFDQRLAVEEFQKLFALLEDLTNVDLVPVFVIPHVEFHSQPLEELPLIPHVLPESIWNRSIEPPSLPLKVWKEVKHH